MSDSPGVLRMSFAPDGTVVSSNENDIRNTSNPAHAPAPSESNFNHGSEGNLVTRTNADGSVTTTGNLTRVSTADLLPDSRGGIMMSARSAGGRFVSGPDLDRPGVTVSIDGTEATRVSLKAAMTMGYVIRSGNGEWLDGRANMAAQDAEKAAAQEKAVADSQELFTDGFEAELAQAIQPVDQGVYDAQVTHVLNNDGVLDPQGVQTMAAQMGVSTAQVVEIAQKAIAKFSAQAAAAAAGAGVPASEYQAFINWAHAERPDQLKEARRLLGLGRSTSGFKALASEYGRTGSSVPTAAEVRAAGYQVETRNGEDIVTLPDGNKMSIKAIARAGMFKRG